MALEINKKTIGGKIVMVNELPSRYKLKLAMRVAKFVPPIIKNVKGILISALSGLSEAGIKLENVADLMKEDSKFDVVGYFSKLDTESISDMMSGILDIYTPDEVLEFCIDVLQETVIAGTNASSILKEGFAGEDYFKDDFPLLFQVVVYTLEANRFFGKAGIGTRLKEMMKSL